MVGFNRGIRSDIAAHQNSAATRFPQLAVLGLTAALLMSVALTSGCGKSNSGANASAASTQPKVVDGSAVRKAFDSAEPDIKYAVENSVSIAESGGFGDVLSQLQKIAANPRLTPEQKRALDEFIQQIKTHWSEGQGKSNR